MHPSPSLIMTLLLLLPASSASSTPIQTISALPDYNRQRPCATSCFYNEVDDDMLGANMKCCQAFGTPTCKGGVPEHCFCRSDLRPTAVDWLSRCVETRCSTAGGVDYSSALGVYDGYCSGVVQVEAGDVPVPTTTIGGNGGGGVGGGVTQTVTGGSTVVTQTVGSGTSSLRGGSARRLRNGRVSLVVILGWLMIS